MSPGGCRGSRAEAQRGLLRVRVGAGSCGTATLDTAAPRNQAASRAPPSPSSTPHMNPPGTGSTAHSDLGSAFLTSSRGRLSLNSQPGGQRLISVDLS